MSYQLTVDKDNKEKIKQQVEGIDWDKALDASEVLFETLRLYNCLPPNHETDSDHHNCNAFGLLEEALLSFLNSVTRHLTAVTGESKEGIWGNIRREMPGTEGSELFGLGRRLFCAILMGQSMLESAIEERGKREEKAAGYLDLLNRSE